MNTRNILRVVALIWTVAGVVGCSSAPQIRELADKTAANVGAISTHLRRLDASSRAMAERRAANIAHLHTANLELRAQYQYDVALTRRTGGGDNLGLIEDIEAWRNEVDDLFAAAGGAEADFAQAVLATQQSIDTKSKALAEIAQALSELAREEKAGERARFLAGYAKSLKAELETALAADTDTAKAAKKLLDAVAADIETNFGSANPQ